MVHVAYHLPLMLLSRIVPAIIMDRVAGIFTSPSLPVVICNFLWAFGNIGIVKTMGIYLDDITLSLGTTSTDIGIAFGLYGAFSSFPAPLIAALCRWPSVRRPLFIFGACLPATGIALVAIATSNAQIAVFLSLSGFGNCILVIYNTLALHNVAGENYNLLFSLSLTGFDIGTVMLPFLAEMLLGTYGWRGGLLIIGALMAHIVPSAMAVNLKSEAKGGFQSLPRSNPEGTTEEEEEDEDKCSGRITRDGVNELDHENNIGEEDHQLGVYHRILHSLRQSDFYMDPVINVTIGVGFVFYMVYSGWHSFLVPHALQRGISVRNTIAMTFVASIGNMCSRIVIGVLTNNHISPVSLFLFATLVNISALICDVFFGNYYAMLVTSCLSAMAIGSRAVLETLVVRERASASKFDVAFAVNECVIGLGFLLGGFISGMIADRFSSYGATFKLLAVMDVLVLVLITIVRCKPKQSST